MKPNEVPRYGTHDGIKYSPKRTIFRRCKYCDTPILIQGRGRKPTTCSYDCKQQMIKGYISDRDKRNLQWKLWYNNMFVDQRINYISKKKRNNKKTCIIANEDELRAEYEALGLKFR